MYLQSQDISLGTALKIYKFYGDETEKIVSQNPYKLIEDIDGIGFVTADRIALRQGLPTNSPFRIRAGLLHELDQAGENGNTYLPIDELVPLTAQLLSCEQASVEDEIDDLLLWRCLHVQSEHLCQCHIVRRVQLLCPRRILLYGFAMFLHGAS